MAVADVDDVMLEIASYLNRERDVLQLSRACKAFRALLFDDSNRRAQLAVQRLGNVGQSDATGAEFEFTWLASDRLSVFGNVGLIDAKFNNVISYDANLNQIDITNNFVITNTPKRTINVGYSYDMPVASGDMVLTGNYSYRSKYSLSELGNVLEQDAYGILNLGVSWTSADGKWAAGLHGKNLTEEEFLVGNYAFLGAANPALPNGYAPGLGGDTTLIGYYGAPRTVSLSLGYNF
jgi:iron complex outermembrane receptor protein